MFSSKKMQVKLPSAKGHQFYLGLNVLIHKKLEMHGCIISTVATDALVPKHQGISIHSADY